MCRLDIFCVKIRRIFKIRLKCMRKFPKFRTIFLTSTPSPHDFSDPYWPPEQCPTREYAKIKKCFLQNAIFHFLLFFSPFLNSTQSEFGRYKDEFKHCTPPVMVSLASSTLSVPILIPKWGQNTTKERQDMHIPKYLHFHPSFLALFLHFFSIACCKWIV